MKRKNKETGEIAHFEIYKITGLSDDGNPVYEPFKGNIEDWEDYEEQKDYYIINLWGEVCVEGGKYQRPGLSELGLTFGTKEEAELAVRKLKAWKRLKDKGFKFKYYTRKFDGFKRVDGSVFIVAKLDDEGVIGMIDELNICFGGEE